MQYPVKRCISLIAALLFVTHLPAQNLPEGEGRDKVIFACTGCHGLENITAPHRPLSAEEWEVHLYDMIAKGANLTVDEFETVKDYLIKNFAVEKN